MPAARGPRMIQLPVGGCSLTSRHRLCYCSAMNKHEPIQIPDDSFDPNAMRALGVRLVALHGSRARGTARADSDYDVAVLTERDRTLNDLAQYTCVREAVRHALRLSDVQELDLADLNRANPLLLRQVAERGQLLFGNEQDFVALKLRAFHRYVDYQQYFALERALNHAAYADRS